uniref:PIN domain-containing protein n=1 Tax=Kalanchoe fedtschenkoi TaxID=63787 RepID=A0A7N1A7R0_KALFE
MTVAVENKDEECILVNTAKDIEQHVMASESPIPDFTLEEIAASAEVGNIGKEFEDVCQLSYLESEVPKPLADMKGTIHTESTNETQQLQLVGKTSKHVPDPEAIRHKSSNLTSEDQIHQSEMVKQAPVLDTLVKETMVTNSASGDQLSGLDVQILEPLLNSFLFPENDEEYQEKVVSKSEDRVSLSDPECLSPKTPSNDESKSQGSLNVVSGQKLSTTNLCSITCKPVSTHQVSTSHTKGKRFESSLGPVTQQQLSGVYNKMISGDLFTDFINSKDDIEMSTSEERNITPNIAVVNSNERASVLDENTNIIAMSDRPGLLKGSSSPLRKSMSKTKIADKYSEDGIGTYTPDNVFPNCRLLKSLVNTGTLDQNEVNSTVSWRSDTSKVANSPTKMEQDLFASDKENQTPVIFLKRKHASSTFADKTSVDNEMTSARRQGEQIPLQPVLVDSSGKSINDASVFNVSCRSVSSISPVQAERTMISGEREGRVKWYMVVDSSCLLIEESRKELQLLQGLRGTRLFVPGTVLRELERLEKATRLFGRTAEVRAALTWLRNCMEKTEWWIHIQSSSVEEKHLTQPPPASPRQQHYSLDLGNWRWASSSVFRSFKNVPSFKAEDVVQCALQLASGMDCEGKVAILSDDLALKTKAMAEGLTCETASEFRNSLINPFSGRFLWAKSSPRGHTWSASDDVVLKELFYSSYSNKSLNAQGSVKGLKLLLPLNSTVQSEQQHCGRSSQPTYRYLFPCLKFHGIVEYLKHQMTDSLFS